MEEKSRHPDIYKLAILFFEIVLLIEFFTFFNLIIRGPLANTAKPYYCSFPLFSDFICRSIVKEALISSINIDNYTIDNFLHRQQIYSLECYSDSLGTTVQY